MAGLLLSPTLPTARGDRVLVLHDHQRYAVLELDIGSGRCRWPHALAAFAAGVVPQLRFLQVVQRGPSTEQLAVPCDAHLQCVFLHRAGCG